eukprot:8962495-Pyramimonas_sp.AAC.1
MAIENGRGGQRDKGRRRGIKKPKASEGTRIEGCRMEDKGEDICKTITYYIVGNRVFGSATSEETGGILLEGRIAAPSSRQRFDGSVGLRRRHLLQGCAERFPIYGA